MRHQMKYRTPQITCCDPDRRCVGCDGPGQSRRSSPALQAAQAQDVGQPARAPRTPWGEPDFQGIWSVELLVPLERPSGTTTEFYTEEQVAELDRERANTSVFGNHVRAAPGSEADVAAPTTRCLPRSGRPAADRDDHRSAGRESASPDAGRTGEAGRDSRL